MLRVSNSHEPGPAFGRSPRGFTMVELMVTLTVIAIVALALTAVLMNANDLTGTEAARTRNPDDFVLMRQVLGDSVGNLAGSNGPDKNEAVALVRKPGGTVAPFYTVYLKGQTTPWNWASGPIPEAQLA